MTDNSRPSSPAYKMAYNNENRTVESKADFVEEYRSLIADFEGAIGNLEQYQKTSKGGPSVELVEDLNRFKLHRKKLVDMMASYENVDEEKWVEIRPEAQDIFAKATKAWQRKSEALTEKTA